MNTAMNTAALPTASMQRPAGRVALITASHATPSAGTTSHVTPSAGTARRDGEHGDAEEDGGSEGLELEGQPSLDAYVEELGAG